MSGDTRGGDAGLGLKVDVLTDQKRGGGAKDAEFDGGLAPGEDAGEGLLRTQGAGEVEALIVLVAGGGGAQGGAAVVERGAVVVAELEVPGFPGGMGGERSFEVGAAVQDQGGGRMILDIARGEAAHHTHGAGERDGFRARGQDEPAPGKRTGAGGEQEQSARAAEEHAVDGVRPARRGESRTARRSRPKTAGSTVWGRRSTAVKASNRGSR